MNANLFKWNMMCTFVIAGVVHLNAQPGFFLFIFFLWKRKRMWKTNRKFERRRRFRCRRQQRQRDATRDDKFALNSMATWYDDFRSKWNGLWSCQVTYITNEESVLDASKTIVRVRGWLALLGFLVSNSCIFRIWYLRSVRVRTCVQIIIIIIVLNWYRTSVCAHTFSVNWEKASRTWGFGCLYRIHS